MACVAMTCVAQRRKESLQTLIDSGFLQPLKRGRPQIYQNDEDRLAALKEQKKACSRNYGERVRAARALLKEAPRSTDEVKNVEVL